MSRRRAIDWTFQDIQALLTDGEQENLMLEYKASMAIGDWTDSRRNELAKDLCAFANAAGGVIVIGIGEVAHKPAILDDGIDTTLVSKEAVESALQARISPRIDALTIKEIPNPAKPDFSYFVIGIPRSMRAPHMCNPFHRYYKRYNFESVPMEHYEVEDVRRRQSEPVLKAICALEVVKKPRSDTRTPNLLVGVVNEGSVTARDVLVRFYVPRWLVDQATWSPNGTHHAMTHNGVEVYRFDAYVRDNAGPIPIYPHDDQPYLVTRGAARHIALALPASETPALATAQIVVQVFAENMRMRSFEIPVVRIIHATPPATRDEGNTEAGG